MPVTRKEYKRTHNKGDMMNTLIKQQKTIQFLRDQLYWTNVLKNGCFEADMIVHGWEQEKKNAQS